MKTISKSKSVCSALTKKENDQRMRTAYRTDRRNSKRVTPPPIKEKRLSQKGKNLALLIDQGEMSADEYKKIRKILNSIPDVRSEKVLSLKKAILQGRYQIKPQAIAQKILKEIIFESN